MDSKKLRRLFLDYFANKHHVIIPGASLVPEHDPSVLFTTAGMHPLVPFLMGQAHPAGRRLANCQKCLRTDDIFEVGDDIHLTFFEMLGNWSLGDYWKREAIQMSFEFLTDWLGLAADRLHITCFEGDSDAPQDIEAYETWRSLGVHHKRIHFLPKKDNWWGPVGVSGPCGPDTEMFYDIMPLGPPDQTPKTNPGRFWEVWNIVFMGYDRVQDGSFVPTRQKNVDTGLGLERAIAILEGVHSVYETELFVPLMEQITSLSKEPNLFGIRVIADHVRSAVFILAEGIVPANTDQPYVARRLIRRAIRHGRKLGIDKAFLCEVAETAMLTLCDIYGELQTNKQHILSAIEVEEGRFSATLQKGEKEFSRVVNDLRDRQQEGLDGAAVFRLYDTHGFPPELTEELAAEAGLKVDMISYREYFEQHQSASRTGASSRFKGGLADGSELTVRLHTATHLLHAALREVLGNGVEQRGSNITSERLRFDFSHDRGLTREEVQRAEQLVNEQICRNLLVDSREMTIAEAMESGAIGLFSGRYGNVVRVYSIGDFSKEICGGPHAKQAGELGKFRILKEEAVGSGVRRIRAILEPAAEHSS
jgi:alanyl-tRNA synthetase